jgi:hypothetical protein
MKASALLFSCSGQRASSRISLDAAVVRQFGNASQDASGRRLVTGGQSTTKGTNKKTTVLTVNIRSQKFKVLMGNYCVTRPARIVLGHPLASKCRVESTGICRG